MRPRPVTGFDDYSLVRPSRPVAKVIKVEVEANDSPSDERVLELVTAEDWLNAVKAQAVPWHVVRDNEENILGEEPDRVVQNDFDTILDLAVCTQGGGSFK